MVICRRKAWNIFKIFLIVILFFLESSFAQLEVDDEWCPSIGGEDFKCNQTSVLCLSSLTQKDCPEGKFIVKDGSTCGCCPGCRGGGEIGEYCDDEEKCAPGLMCRSKECIYDKSTCAYTYHLQHLKALPTCEIDGTFAAVQCKGDPITGRCFCYSEEGERIFGWSWWKDANEMTCSCSRLKYRLNKGGFLGNTFHCDQNGNFEPLQCNDGICWCADPRTGEVLEGIPVVPQTLWTFLPCYDVAKVGTQYLRQCESALYAQQQIKKTFHIHGTTNVEFINIKCDFDGSYGTYHIADGIASCQWKDGKRIGSFQSPSNTVSMMNCYCARDQKIFSEAGLSLTLACGGNGNYATLQDINGKMFCVDNDGFAVTEPEETHKVPDCEKFLYYKIDSNADFSNGDNEENPDEDYGGLNAEAEERTENNNYDENMSP